MKSHHRLTLTAAFALVVILGTSVAMTPAMQQDKPAPKTPPAAKDKPAAPPEGMPPMPPPPGEHHKWLEKLVGNWTGKLEYLYMDLGTFTGTGILPAPASPPLRATFSSRITDNILRAGINYKFSECFLFCAR
jgi:hypothetical protein